MPECNVFEAMLPRLNRGISEARPAEVDRSDPRIGQDHRKHRGVPSRAATGDEDFGLFAAERFFHPPAARVVLPVLKQAFLGKSFPARKRKGFILLPHLRG